MADNNLFAVRLVNQSNRLEKVVFDVSPDLVETRSVNYSSVDPIHAPGQIFAYKNTASRVFNISNVRLVSRTPEEAEYNMIRLQRLRGWTMPVFGVGSSTLTTENTLNREAGFTETDVNEIGLTTGVELLGAPPPVLLLSAYSKTTNGTTPSKEKFKQENIKKVPVVIQQLGIPYPSDVDYINTTSGVPFPMIFNLDMTLAETHSPIEYERFSIAHFKSGTLPGF